METKREVFQADEVQKLKLEVGCGTVYVKESTDSNQIQVDVLEDETGTYSSSLENGKLKIRFKMKQKKLHMNECKTVITVTVPAGKVFEKVKAEIGAGMFDTQKAELHSDRIKFEVGAGNAKIGSIKAQTFTAECGAGQLDVAKAVANDMDISCGVGKCEINVEGKSTDYNFDLNYGIGKIYINDEKLSRKDGNRQAAGIAAGTIHVSCGVGTIRLNIA